MDFKDKLQQLRKQKNITQEKLASILFVSRTAISKWESGKGYPNIDSLKRIAEYFNVTVDELLSNNELIIVAQNENKTKIDQYKNITFGLLDCLLLIFFFLPFFGYKIDGVIYEVSLLNLQTLEMYVLVPYYILIILTICFGIAMLTLQNNTNNFWLKYKYLISIFLSTISCLFFMLTMQPYAGSLTLVLLVIKGILFIKK